MAHYTIRYDRSTLYDEVWKEPLREVAKRYRVSDVGLSKTCRRLGIPLPPQGYWLRQKEARGERPALPPAQQGLRVSWEVNIHVPHEEETVDEDPVLRAKLAAETASEAAIIVPHALVSPHKLVAATTRALRGAKPYEGLVSSRSSAGCLNVRVAPTSIKRAALILDTLLRALEARGLTVAVKKVTQPGYGRSWSTVVAVDGEELSFILWEKYSLRPTPPPPNLDKKALERWMTFRRRNERAPNGRFAMEIRHHGTYGAVKSWSDTDKRKIETQLNAFVAQLYVAAASIKERRRAQQQAQLERDAADQRERAAEARRRAEKQRRAELEEQLVQWRFARDARTFVLEVRTMLSHRGLPVTRGGHVEEWLAWIAEQADKADPLAKMRLDADEMASKHRTRRPILHPLGSKFARASRRRRARG